MLRVGDRVPDFTLKMCTREETIGKPGCRTFTLSERLGGKRIIFNFLGGVFVGDCTRQVCEFRDALDLFHSEGFDVYSFNTDGHFWNTAFARSVKLNFPIIGDPKKEVAPKIWELVSPLPLRSSPRHGMMIIGTTGLVEHVVYDQRPTKWIGLAMAFKDYEPRSAVVSRLLASFKQERVKPDA